MDATQWGVPDPRRDSLKHTFEEAADTYDAARPRYPQPLFDDLAELGRLRSDASLLEIGCGTGIATLPMAQRGFSILALEVGPKLASKAAEKLATFPEVDVITAPFETWEPEAHDFDLVYAATSWHWLDPEIRYDKAASLLKGGGSLAIFGATHAFPADADPFFFEIQEIYEALDESHPGEQWPPPRPEDIPDHSQEILSSGRFEDVTVRRYVWHSDYTAEEYIALLDTFSGHIAMEREKRDFLYAEIRKRISLGSIERFGVTGSPSFTSRLGHKCWGFALRRRGRSPIDMHPEPGARGYSSRWPLRRIAERDAVSANAGSSKPVLCGTVLLA